MNYKISSPLKLNSFSEAFAPLVLSAAGITDETIEPPAQDDSGITLTVSRELTASELAAVNAALMANVFQIVKAP